MRRIVPVLVTFLGMLAACSAVTLNPAKREFWLGGTVDPTDRARAARADSLHTSAAAYRDEFFGCMGAYGAKHATSNNTAAEIADAAGATCEPPLSQFMGNAREAEELIIAAAHAKPSSELGLRDRMEIDLADIRRSIAERGRQLAVKAVVDARP